MESLIGTCEIVKMCTVPTIKQRLRCTSDTSTYIHKTVKQLEILGHQLGTSQTNKMKILVIEVSSCEAWGCRGRRGTPSYISRKNSRYSFHDPYSLRTLHYYDLVEHSCSAADAPRAGGRGRAAPGGARSQRC